MESIVSSVSLITALLTGDPQVAQRPEPVQVSAASVKGAVAGRVVGISDGDTLTILTEDKQQVRIRIFGIDAPEKKQPFGTRSRQALSALCYKANAVVLPNGKSYDRIVGTVSCNGSDVSRFMVGSGMAWVYERYSKDPALLALQARAQKEKTGLWSDPNPVPPWEFRRQKRNKT